MRVYNCVYDLATYSLQLVRVFRRRMHTEYLYPASSCVRLSQPGSGFSVHPSPRSDNIGGTLSRVPSSQINNVDPHHTIDLVALRKLNSDKISHIFTLKIAFIYHNSYSRIFTRFYKGFRRNKLFRSNEMKYNNDLTGYGIHRIVVEEHYMLYPHYFTNVDLTCSSEDPFGSVRS